MEHDLGGCFFCGGVLSEDFNTEVSSVDAINISKSPDRDLELSYRVMLGMELLLDDIAKYDSEDGIWVIHRNYQILYIHEVGSHFCVDRCFICAPRLPRPASLLPLPQHDVPPSFAHPPVPPVL
jgi:hypothetical protein